MGRFYKTAKAQNIDYAFRFPAELLARAVDKKDAEIDDALKQLQIEEDKLTTQKNNTKSSVGQGMHMENDIEAYNSEIASHESKIDEITNAILNDIPNSGKQRANIGKLRSDIATSMSSGNLHTFNTNYNTAKDFLKKNEKSNPQMVNAAYSQAMEKWKGSIGEDGKYRMLSDFLPSALYDVDIKKKALGYDRIIDKNRSLDDRTSLIHQNLSEDEDVRNSIMQRLQLGLVTDETGAAINIEGLSEKEISGVFNRELYNQARNVAKTTAKIKKPTTGKIKDGDKPATSSGQTRNETVVGRGILDDAIAFKPTDDDGNRLPLFLSVAYTSQYYNSEVDKFTDKTNPFNKTLIGTNQQIYKKVLDDVINQVTEEFVNSNGMGRNAVNPVQQNGSYTPEFIARASELLAEKNKPTETVYDLGWNKMFTKDEQTAITKDITEFVDDESMMEKAVLKSSNQLLNNKSITQLKEERTIGFNISNKAKLKEEIKNIAELYKIPEADINYESTKNEEGKEIWKIKFSHEIDNEMIEESQDLEIKRDSKSNFQITSKTPEMTRTTDENGNPYFRIGAKLTNEDGEEELMSLYINSKNLNSSTLNSAKSIGNTKDVNKLKKKYDYAIGNQISLLYNKLVATELPDGEVIDITDNVKFKYENGKPVLHLLKEEEVYRNPSEIQDFLTSIFNPYQK